MNLLAHAKILPLKNAHVIKIIITKFQKHEAEKQMKKRRRN